MLSVECEKNHIKLPVDTISLFCSKNLCIKLKWDKNKRGDRQDRQYFL